jgi:hypothetical protein
MTGLSLGMMPGLAPDQGPAGGCWVRMTPGRILATFHPDAPEGASWCAVCKRTVYRGAAAFYLVYVMRRRYARDG